MVKMARVVLIYFCFIFTFAGVYSKKDSEADFRKLPKLFHLDDFEQCLERKDGVYCLGQFEIYNDVQPNPLYDLIQEKSQDLNLYNRSYLHRGYCLPTRCPGGEANASARFERCVDAWARTHSLRARLHTLHYCRAHGQPRPGTADTNDLPHRLLLYFVWTMLVMAVVGTFYDFFIAKKGSKNPLLMSFSLRINWSHLMSNNQEVDPRLRSMGLIDTLRFFMGIGLVNCHVFIHTTAAYQNNPRTMEKMLFSVTGKMLGASMTSTLSFLLISNFLTTYNLLVTGEKVHYSLKNFPLLVIKRVVRMYPIYLLLNGFAATWWRSFGDGPLWPLFIARESEVCRNKFWVTVAFLQNFIDKRNLCLVQTWIMAVDMQLHMFTLFVSLLLLNHRKHAMKVLSVLLVAATALVAHQAFEHDLMPTYSYTTPEVYRHTFNIKEGDSFFDLYIHPINGIIVAIVGSMLAFKLYEHQERGIHFNNYKIFHILNWISVPGQFIWWYICYKYCLNYDRETQHLMIVIERLIPALITTTQVYCFIQHKGFLYNFFVKDSLRIVARLSMSLSMCHWCISCLLFADRWSLHDSSGLQVISDTISVYVLTHIVAVPLTLLVEYPVQKVVDRLLNQTGYRWFAPLKAKSK